MNKKILSLLLSLCLALNAALPAAARELRAAPAENGYVQTAEGDVSPEEVAKAMEIVTKAIKGLPGVFSDKEETNIFISVFNGISSAVSTMKTIENAINYGISFLKLVGLIEDEAARKQADMMNRMRIMDEKLTEINAKLDDISKEMTEFRASEEFNIRTEAARDMHEYWKQFENSYMETTMDDWMTRYESMLLNGIRKWCVNSEPDARKAVYSGGIDNSSVTLLYLPEGDDWKLTFSTENGVPADFAENGRYLVLPESIIPQSVRWNVETYRDELVSGIRDNLTDAVSSGSYGIFDSRNFPQFDGTETAGTQLLEQISSDAADVIVYRVAAVEVNKDANFSKQVLRNYQNYCKHLLDPEDGMDAMCKWMYLTHAFEYQIADDLSGFCDQMTVRTATYGTFVSNVIGLSSYIKDNEKTEFVNTFTRTLNALGEIREKGLTGCDNFCYITYSEPCIRHLTFFCQGQAETTADGSSEAVTSCSADSIWMRVDGRPYSPDARSGEMIGDVNALVLAYTLQSCGIKPDWDYLYSHLHSGTGKLTDSGYLLTGYTGQQNISNDTRSLFRVTRVIGDFFTNESNITINSLPGKASSEYLQARRMIAGSKYNTKTFGIEQNKMIIGMTIYAESHWNWWDDECAFIAGTSDDPGFSKTFQTTVLKDYGKRRYRHDYIAYVDCNGLMQNPIAAALRTGGENDPLFSYKLMLSQINGSGQFLTSPTDSDTQIIRLGGTDRYDTAGLICSDGWSSAETVIIASGESYPDALAGAVLAHKLDAPILLTSKNSLSASTLEVIERLGAKQAVILGGTSAVSGAVEDKLKAVNVMVKRIYGVNRNATAARIAEAVGDGSGTVCLVSGSSFADALSVSAAAALAGQPVLFLNTDGSVPDETREMLKKLGAKNAVIVGGTAAIGETAEDELDKLDITTNRIYGEDRYATSFRVYNHYSTEFSHEKISVASGAGFPDALAGAAYAAHGHMPLLLVGDKLSDELRNNIETESPEKIYVFGGTSAVPDSALTVVK